MPVVKWDAVREQSPAGRLINRGGLRLRMIIDVYPYTFPVFHPTPPFGHRTPSQELQQVETINIGERLIHDALHRGVMDSNLFLQTESATRIDVDAAFRHDVIVSRSTRPEELTRRAWERLHPVAGAP